MDKKLEDMSVVELKALWFDHIAETQRLEQNMTAIKQALDLKLQQPKKASSESKDDGAKVKGK
jgi:hypothetical protein